MLQEERKVPADRCAGASPHPLDLPFLKGQPSAEVLLAALDSLALPPPSWDRPVLVADDANVEDTPEPCGAADGVGMALSHWLTRLVGSDLWWIEDDDQRERIWGLASTRLAERCGRSAAPALTRTFKIPRSSNCPTAPEEDSSVAITLHEPPMVSDALGLKTWGSSYLLSKRLHHLVPTVLPITMNSEPAPLQALELGSGTGLVGLAAAALFGWDLHLTDLPDVVPNLSRNITANSHLICEQASQSSTSIEMQPSVVARVLDWTQPLADDYWRERVESFDIILASDPLYTPQHPELLVSCVTLFLRKPISTSGNGGTFILEHPLRSTHMSEVVDCEARLQAAGLVRLVGGEEVGWDDWGTNTRNRELFNDQHTDGGGHDDIDVEAMGGVRCRWSVWRYQQS